MLKKWLFVTVLVTLLAVLSVSVGAVQSQTTDPPLLTEPGPYGVRRIDMTLVDPSRDNWKLDTYIWYPVDKTQGTPKMLGSLELKDGPPDRGGAPYPLIIYSHAWFQGGTGPGELYDVMTRLTSQGYVVVAPHHNDNMLIRKFELVDRPLDILFILNELATIIEGDLAGMIDTNNVGLMGWNQGAETALQLLGLLRDPVHYASWCAEHPEITTQYDCGSSGSGYWDFDAIAAYRAQLGLQTMPDGCWTSFADPRIHAVFAMAPGDFPLTTEDMLTEVTTPTLLMQGTKDNYGDYQSNAVGIYTHLGTPDRYLITWVKGSTADYSASQDVVYHYATAFFGAYLKGDKTFAPYLTAENVPVLPYPKLFWGPYES